MEKFDHLDNNNNIFTNSNATFLYDFQHLFFYE